MDVLSLLSQAVVKDMDGVELGRVIGVHFVAGKMMVTINMTVFEEESDGPDDGEKEDIPEEDASKMEFPNIVAMSKKTGANNG